MRSFPDILTARCVLNRVTSNDLLALREIFDDVETKRFLPELYALVETDEGLLSFISAFDSYSNNQNGYLWGIRFDGRLVGFIAIMDIPDSPTLFYAMHPNFRLKGIMKECLDAIVRFVAKKISCSFIQSEVFEDNIVSINLLRQLNFKIDKVDHKIHLLKVYL